MLLAKVIDPPAAMRRGMETDQERTRRATAIDHAATHLAMVIDQEPTRDAMARNGTRMHPEMGKPAFSRAGRPDRAQRCSGKLQFHEESVPELRR